MSDLWDSFLGVVGAVAAAVLPVGAWVGTIQQRVSSSEEKHAATATQIAKITERLDDHMRISNNTNYTVGQMNGKLDILVAKHISDSND